MARGTPSALALGPGYLYIAELGTPEPTDLVTPFASVSTAWKGPWYTEAGNTFHYTLAVSPVAVAEELDPIANPATGRTATLDFVFSEVTASNLMRAMNAPTSALIQPGGGLVTLEPPDLGTEVRRMIAWEAEDHTERWIYRQAIQSADSALSRQKGATNATIAMTYNLEKPATGARLFKIIMAQSVRLGS